jgi:tetratricopeptide (TPR) repeat protein
LKPITVLAGHARCRHFILILTILVAGVFGTTIGHEFVWDDSLFVPGGEVYKNFDLRAMFFSLRANGLEYLPVRDVSYALDCALWGENPAGFHFSNLVYYGLNVLAVYLLSSRLATSCLDADPSGEGSEPGEVGFLCAALFAVHPIHCEVVNFITCRNALLSGLFFFLACHAWLQYLTGAEKRRALYYAAALGCFVLSLFAKATGIILPLVLLLITVMSRPSRNRRAWAGLVPFFLLSGGAFFLFTEIARRTDVLPREPFCTTLSCLADKISVAAQIPLFYLSKLVFPAGLSADYGADMFGEAASLRTLGALLMVFLIAVAAWHFRRRYTPFTLGAAWILAALIPVLHLFPTTPVVADRYAYLPSFGFCFLIAAGGVRFVGRRIWLGAVPLLLVLSVLSLRQNRVWKSEKSLWEHTLSVSPRSTTALAELGRIYFREEKNYPKALEMYQRASAIDPHDPAADLFEGHLCMMQGDFPRAVAAFQRALERDNGNIEAVLSLGRAYESAGEISLAKEQYRRAAALPELDPRTNMRERADGALRRLGEE